jgi:hypothetical protein
MTSVRHYIQRGVVSEKLTETELAELRRIRRLTDQFARSRRSARFLPGDHRRIEARDVSILRNLLFAAETQGGKKMPDFTDPFIGKVPDRKLTHEELVRAIRLNVAAEHEAIHLYMAHAEATDHPLAKKVLVDIANEEREHIGEFERLLEILTGDEAEWVNHGREEVNEMAAELEAG